MSVLLYRYETEAPGLGARKAARAMTSHLLAWCSPSAALSTLGLLCGGIPVSAGLPGWAGWRLGQEKGMRPARRQPKELFMGWEARKK